MGGSSIYLGGWTNIGRYHCRWWICAEHGKIAKAIEVVRVVGKVYFVHIPSENFVAIKFGFSPAKGTWRHASRDSPPCPSCKQYDSIVEGCDNSC